MGWDSLPCGIIVGEIGGETLITLTSSSDTICAWFGLPRENWLWRSDRSMEASASSDYTTKRATIPSRYLPTLEDLRILRVRTTCRSSGTKLKIPPVGSSSSGQDFRSTYTQESHCTQESSCERRTRSERAPSTCSEICFICTSARKAHLDRLHRTAPKLYGSLQVSKTREISG